MNFIFGFVIGILITALVPELGESAIDLVDLVTDFLKENV